MTHFRKRLGFSIINQVNEWIVEGQTKPPAEEASQDLYTKKLTTTRYLLFFLYAQLQKGEGVRAIRDDRLMKDFQKELGLGSISASQLSRKNRQVDPNWSFAHLAIPCPAMNCSRRSYSTCEVAGFHNNPTQPRLISIGNISFNQVRP